MLRHISLGFSAEKGDDQGRSSWAPWAHGAPKVDLIFGLNNWIVEGMIGPAATIEGLIDFLGWTIEWLSHWKVPPSFRVAFPPGTAPTPRQGSCFSNPTMKRLLNPLGRFSKPYKFDLWKQVISCHAVVCRLLAFKMRGACWMSGRLYGLYGLYIWIIWIIWIILIIFWLYDLYRLYGQISVNCCRILNRNALPVHCQARLVHRRTLDHG